MKAKRELNPDMLFINAMRYWREQDPLYYPRGQKPRPSNNGANKSNGGT